MSAEDDEILAGFVVESKKLVRECVRILEKVEDGEGPERLLADYANRIDRVMGAAGSLAPEGGKHVLNLIADGTSLCKSLGNQTAKLAHHHPYINVATSFLIDATEMIEELLADVEGDYEKLRKHLQGPLVDRLKWITAMSDKFPEKARAEDSLGQATIDELIKKLTRGPDR